MNKICAVAALRGDAQRRASSAMSTTLLAAIPLRDPTPSGQALRHAGRERADAEAPPSSPALRAPPNPVTAGDVARQLFFALMHREVARDVSVSCVTASRPAAAEPTAAGPSWVAADVAALVDRCRSAGEVADVLKLLCVPSEAVLDIAQIPCGGVGEQQRLLRSVARLGFDVRDWAMCCVAARWEHQLTTSAALTALDGRTLSSSSSSSSGGGGHRGDREHHPEALPIAELCLTMCGEGSRLLGLHECLQTREINWVRHFLRPGAKPPGAEALALLDSFPSFPVVSATDCSPLREIFHDTQFGSVPESQLNAVNDQLSSIGRGSGPATVL